MEKQREVSALDLTEITEQVDKLWSEIRDRRRELQPLLYAAWELFEGKRGKPQAGAETFKGWLEARGIPRKTGYRIRDRERRARGELIVSGDPISELPKLEDKPSEDAVEAAYDRAVDDGPYAGMQLVPRSVEIIPAVKKITEKDKATLEAELETELSKYVSKDGMHDIRIAAYRSQLAVFSARSAKAIEKVKEQNRSYVVSGTWEEVK